MLVLLGPKSGKITGQSKAFTRFTDALEEVETLILDRNKLISCYFLYYLWKLCTVNATHYYLSSSRSTIGFILEAPLLVIAVLRNKPITCHIHGSDFSRFLSRNILARWLYSRPIVQICLIHQYFIDSVEKLLGKKVLVVENFVDYENVLEKPIKDIDLIWSSNLMIEKGIQEFLSWILDRSNEDLKIVIIGNIIGTDKEIKRIKELLEKCERNLNKFSFLGPVDSELVHAHLLRAKIFVLISTYRSEAVPLALLEAMACGCFVVVTKFRVLPYLVDSRNAIIIGSREEIFDLSPRKILHEIDSESALEWANLIRNRYNLINHITQLKTIVYDSRTQS